LFLTRAGSRPLDIHIECPPASHLLKIISFRECDINSLFIWNPNRYYSWEPYESYPGGIRYEDVKDLNMRSLRHLDVEDIGCEEAEMLMDLALQSTCEEITFQLIEEEALESSVLRHDFMRRISGLNLSASEFYGVPSEQLTNQLRF
jgi:hypothetical protein